MAFDGSKSIVGCGVGCAVLITLGVMVVVFGGAWVKRSFHSVVEAQQTRVELVEVFGKPDEFTPQSDGSVPPERMEAFLAVRDALQKPRLELEALFGNFPPDELLGDASTTRKVLSALGSVKDLVNPIGLYVSTRNEALLDAEMGLGEYVYIYSLAHYSLLGHSPEDGPVITKDLPPDAEENQGQRIMDGDDSTFSRDEVRRRYRRYTLRMMQRQLDSIERAEVDPWRAALAAEIARFDDHPSRIAWGDGLPPAIEASLLPYRERLEGTYSADCNPFEIPLPDDQSWKISD